MLAHQCPIYKSKPFELSQNVKNILNMTSQRQVESISYAVHCCGYWFMGLGSAEEGTILDWCTFKLELTPICRGYHNKTTVAAISTG